jgi:hypothetical protein
MDLQLCQKLHYFVKKTQGTLGINRPKANERTFVAEIQRHCRQGDSIKFIAD